MAQAVRAYQQLGEGSVAAVVVLLLSLAIVVVRLLEVTLEVLPPVRSSRERNEEWCAFRF
jgi:hypothetical protein